MKRYIDAEAAEAVVRKLISSDCSPFDKQDAIDDLKSIPTADVQEVKHGKWIYKYKGTDYDDIAYCSLCNFYSEDKINNIGQCFHYCPNCGARMDGEEK